MASARARGPARLQTTRTLASGVSRLAKPWTVPIAPAPRIARRTERDLPLHSHSSPPLEPMLPAGRAVVNSSPAPHALCPVGATARMRSGERSSGGGAVWRALQHPCGHRRRVVVRAEWRVGQPFRGRPCRRRLQGALREARHHASLLYDGEERGGYASAPARRAPGMPRPFLRLQRRSPRRGVLPRHAGGALRHIGGLSGAGPGGSIRRPANPSCPRGHHVQPVRHGLLRRGRGRVPAAPRGRASTCCACACR